MRIPKRGPLPTREATKRNLTIRISPLYRQFLNTRESSIAVYLEDLGRGTKEFKEWRKTQP